MAGARRAQPPRIGGTPPNGPSGWRRRPAGWPRWGCRGRRDARGHRRRTAAAAGVRRWRPRRRSPPGAPRSAAARRVLPRTRRRPLAVCCRWCGGRKCRPRPGDPARRPRDLARHPPTGCDAQSRRAANGGTAPAATPRCASCEKRGRAPSRPLPSSTARPRARHRGRPSQASAHTPPAGCRCSLRWRRSRPPRQRG